MSPLGLLSHLSPSTIGMLASPPKIPGVPTLADLQKRANEVTSSLPSYADLRGDQPAGSAQTAQPTKSSTPVRAVSKPIPRVNLDPNAVARTDAVRPPGSVAPTDAGYNPGSGASGVVAGGGSWLSSWLGGSGQNHEALTIPPPPCYAITDPQRRGADAQMRVQMTETGAGMEHGHDQGRARLMKMQKGYGRLQGEIPGERATQVGVYSTLVPPG